MTISDVISIKDPLTSHATAVFNISGDFPLIMIRCIKLFILPNFQLEGMDIGLSLVSQKPKARS